LIIKIKSTVFSLEVDGAGSGTASRHSSLNLHLSNRIPGGTMHSTQNKFGLVIAITIGSSLAFAGGGSDPAITDSYTCANGHKLNASYDAAYQTASVQLAGKTYRVTKATAASGVRYTGDGVKWWTKGNTANLYMLSSNKALAKNCVLQ
jgi:membrane-bound inhibitor of C-type lysozyme